MDFVYLQAKPYETQEKNEKYSDIKRLCRAFESMRYFDRPIYCGVGVHAREDVKLVKEAGGDADICGKYHFKKLHEDIPK